MENKKLKLKDVEKFNAYKEYIINSDGGCSIKTFASHFGLSGVTAYNHLKKFELLDLLYKCGDMQKSDAYWKYLIECNEGATLKSIGAHFGVNWNTVRNDLIRYNLFSLFNELKGVYGNVNKSDAYKKYLTECNSVCTLQSISEHFGVSVSTAYCNLVKYKLLDTFVRHNDAQKSNAYRDYIVKCNGDATLKSIAKHFNIDVGTLSSHFKKYNLHELYENLKHEHFKFRCPKYNEYKDLMIDFSGSGNCNIKSIASHFGVSKQTVFNNLKKFELYDLYDELKNAHIKKLIINRRAGVEQSKADLKNFIKNSKHKLNMKMIADNFNVCDTTVWLYLKKYNLTEFYKNQNKIKPKYKVV